MLDEIKSCFFFHIFHTFSLIRFPTNEITSNEWKSAINAHYPGKIIGGSICFEHFQQSDFKTKNKSQLKPGAIPSIFNEENDVNDTEPINNSHELSGSIEHQNCEECKLKDDLIEKYRKQVDQLQKSLKKERNKAYYLESTKNKLTAALSELKEKRIVDVQLLNALQVFIFSSFMLYFSCCNSF